MPVRVTIDIYSGRPNPVVELEGKEAQDVLDRLKPTELLVADEAKKRPPQFSGGLVERRRAEAA